MVVDTISLCQLQLDPAPDLPATPNSFYHPRLEGEASCLDESIGEFEADLMKQKLNEKRDTKTFWLDNFCWVC